MSDELADPVDVLHVDGDPADVLMIQKSIAQVGAPVRLHIAREGVHAVGEARGNRENAGRPGWREGDEVPEAAASASAGGMQSSW